MTSTPSREPIRDEDLPALHASANAASSAAQVRYLRIVRWDLAALVGGSLATAFSFASSPARQWSAAVGALFLFVSLILTVVLRNKDYAKHWYGGRAIAESIKTLAWRYMSNADPFERDLGAAEVDQRFIQQLGATLQESENLLLPLTGDAAAREQITPAMRDLREAPLETRRLAYLRDRIQEQREWYSRRAATNENAENRFFLVIAVAQGTAVITAILLVIFPSSPFNSASVLATLAAALLAWLQVKRHQELAQSYHELGLIVEQGRHVATEDEFSAFVGDAEAAISREHTLWVARRDVPLPGQRLRS